MFGREAKYAETRTPVKYLMFNYPRLHDKCILLVFRELMGLVTIDVNIPRSVVNRSNDHIDARWYAKRRLFK